MNEQIKAVMPRAAPTGDGLFGVARKAVVPAQQAPADGERAEPGTEIAGGPASLDEAVEVLERHAADAGADLTFRVDDELGRVIVTLVDRRDGTVIRQIPGEEALRIARNLARMGSGFINAVA